MVWYGMIRYQVSQVRKAFLSSIFHLFFIFKVTVHLRTDQNIEIEISQNIEIAHTKDRKELDLKEVIGPVSAVQESIIFC